jgi:hypothetical protein
VQVTRGGFEGVADTGVLIIELVERVNGIVMVLGSVKFTGDGV